MHHTKPFAFVTLLASLGFGASFAGCAANVDPSSDPNANVADDTQTDARTAESIVGTVPIGSTLVTTAALRLRTGPSTSAGIILVMPAGADVTAVSGVPQSGWYHVNYAGHVGYAFGAYLDRVGSSSPPPSSGGGLSCSHVQWWNTYLTSQSMSGGWHDTDIGIGHGTPIQLRHDSRLDSHGVYGWGWMPEFTDMVTGERFRFLHLLPQDRWTTSVGTVYPAGTVVGLSGGDTRDTGLGVYSTGAHLCVQSLASYRTCFPAGVDHCH